MRMDRLIMAMATGLGLGYLPKAPGTWGTLLAFPLHFLIILLPEQGYFIALGVIFFLAVIISGSAEKIIDHKDPGIVVIDEIIGMLIALMYVPITPFYLILAFILFRIFDIFKPFPIRWIDKRINGGLGIVMDDVIAGLFTLFIIQLLCGYLVE